MAHKSSKAETAGNALTHIDSKGEARMVDVSGKPATERTAVAEGRVIMSKATLELITVDITPDSKLPGCIVRSTVNVTGPTGVEMEALTAVSVACLTIYDMVKAVERGVRIDAIHLLEKKGGKSGHYRA
jgi:cyclic pyranopterin phosphate synthase